MIKNAGKRGRLPAFLLIMVYALVITKEGVSIDKNATSLQNKSEGQAVKVETPSVSNLAQGADSVKPKLQKSEKTFENQRKAGKNAETDYVDDKKRREARTPSCVFLVYCLIYI